VDAFTPMPTLKRSPESPCAKHLQAVELNMNIAISSSGFRNVFLPEHRQSRLTRHPAHVT